MLWIIEPHSDDAYLSLHDHITSYWRGIDKTIVTCYGSGPALYEARYYAHATGCQHKALNLTEHGWAEFEPMLPIEEFVEYKPGDGLILPLGIRQPQHLAIAALRIPSGITTVLRYLDAKYMQPTSAQEVTTKVYGKKIISIRCASSEKLHYKNIFATQATRFLLAPDLYPPMVEILVE